MIRIGSGTPAEIAADIAREEEERARRALEYRLAEVQREIRALDRSVQRFVTGIDPWREKAERNAAIFDRCQGGATLATIACEFGISKERVRQICAREKRAMKRKK